MLLSLMAAHEQQRERADNLQKKSDELYIENLRLQVQVDRFKRWYYGPRADRLSTALELGQMLLAFGEEFDSKPVNKEDLPADEAPDESPRRIRKSRGRRNLENFGKLPVQEHVYELSEAERACPCCGKQRKEIGADESWQLEYYPGHFERLHHVRKKYACVGCDAEGDNPRIESAVKPAAAIDKGLPGPGLLSYITTCKFDMYLPLYRLENHFERQGFRIARSTQSIWCGDVADFVEPVYRRMIERVLQSHPDVADAAVIPIFHERWGEVGRALLMPKPGVELKTDSVREHCLAHLAKYKVPAEFLIVEPFERNGSGKLPKADLKKKYGS